MRHISMSLAWGQVVTHRHIHTTHPGARERLVMPLTSCQAVRRRCPGGGGTHPDRLRLQRRDAWNPSNQPRNDSHTSTFVSHTAGSKLPALRSSSAQARRVEMV